MQKPLCVIKSQKVLYMTAHLENCYFQTIYSVVFLVALITFEKNFQFSS